MLLNSHELSSAEWRSSPVVRALRRVERLLLWPLKPLLSRSGYVRMNPDGRLRDYPFVVVRFACRDCPRMGRYRLAILVERFGADADLETVLEAISASCPRQLESHPGRGCRAYYPDLPPTQPPDLPADLLPQRLRPRGAQPVYAWCGLTQTEER